MMTIKNRLRLVAFIPIALLILLSSYFLVITYQNFEKANALKTVLENNVALDDLLIQIGKERGLTSLYLGSNRKSFITPLKKQRKTLDKAIVHLKDNLNTDISTYLPFLTRNMALIDKEKYQILLDNLRKLQYIRKNVDSKKSNFSDIFFKNYTELLSTPTIDNMLQISNFSLDMEIGSLINNLNQINIAKENSGLERGFISYFMAKKEALSFKDIALWDGFKTKSNGFDHKNIMDKEVAQKINAIYNSPKNREVLKDLAEISSAIQTDIDNGDYSEDPTDWFTLQTKKISILSKAQIIVSNKLWQKSELFLQKQIITLAISISIWLLALILAIVGYTTTKGIATNIKELELKAKMIRLQAEAEGKQFKVAYDLEQKMPRMIHNERSLYLSRQKQINAKIRGLEDKKRQKEQELKSTIRRIVNLRRSVKLIDEEVKMTKPMVKQGVKSKVGFMKLQREQNKVQEDLNTAESSIPSIEAGISEISNNIEEAKGDFRNQAKKELNEVTAEAMRIKESSEALGDQMERTMVRSPIKGVIQKLYVHTVGGVIKPGDDLVEIVPTDAVLWLEVKIKPSDIAFIYPGQKAVVKVSAYDFAVYGSLDGEVVHISADTIKDKKENSFYTIHIKTNKNYLGSEKKPLKIIPGMVVNVDILTGKKSVMDYILKPILKAKQYTFTER